MKRSVPRALAVLAAAALGACDLPTSLPRVESRYVLPGPSATLTVDDLLPAGVARAGDSFRVTLDPVPVPPRTLGQLCGDPCAPLEGQRVPKPAFTTTIPVRVSFPAELVSATLAGGSVRVTLRHDFGFDPLQPSGRAADGRITITVQSGGRIVGTGVLTGPFPSGTERTLTVALAPGELDAALDLSLELVSPAGGSEPEHWITVDNDATLSGEVAPQPIDLSELRLDVRNRSVSSDPEVLDLSGIDPAIEERVRSGAVVVDLTNPFALAGDLTLRLSTPGTTLSRTVRLEAGTTRQRLEFTGAEIRSLLGQPVTLTLAGTVDAPDPVAVRPGQAVTIETLLDLVLALGPE